MSEHPRAHAHYNHESAPALSRQEAEAKVDDYRQRLIDGEKNLQDLHSEKVDSSDEVAVKQIREKRLAALKANQELRAEFDAFVGPEMVEAYREVDRFNEEERQEPGEGASDSKKKVYGDYQKAEENLADAKAAFYGQFKDGDPESTPVDEESTAEQETNLEEDAESLKNALESFEVGEPIDPEKLEEIVTAAFGETVTAHVLSSNRLGERLRTEEGLHIVMKRMITNKRGPEIESSPENIELFKSIFDADDLKASLNGGSTTSNNQLAVPAQNGTDALMPQQANPDMAPTDSSVSSEQADQEDEPTDNLTQRRKTWMRRVLGAPGRTVWKGYSKLFDLGANRLEKYRDLDEADKEKYRRRSAWIAGLGATAVGTVLYFSKLEHLAGSAFGGNSGAEDLHVTTTNPTDHNNQPGVNSGLSPEQLFEQSHKTEMDFLNTNGRVHNDFNNIPVDSPNGPEHANLFHGFDKLQEEYQKSPVELSAQLHQIQTIEMANGHHFDALPQNLQLQPGENPDAYAARLSDAIHHDQALHAKLTGATMDYLQQHGRPTSLDQSYYSWWIGKDGVAHWEQQPITSGDPNDVIIHLSDTKGIRLPCGQPIELIPQQHVTPVAQTAVYQKAPETIAPTPMPEAPAPVAPAVDVPPVIPVIPSQPLPPPSIPWTPIPTGGLDHKNPPIGIPGLTAQGIDNFEANGPAPVATHQGAETSNSTIPVNQASTTLRAPGGNTGQHTVAPSKVAGHQAASGHAH